MPSCVNKQHFYSSQPRTVPPFFLVVDENPQLASEANIFQQRRQDDGSRQREVQNDS